MIFLGEWMLGMRYGEGRLKYFNGVSYIGYWEFDKVWGIRFNFV